MTFNLLLLFFRHCMDSDYLGKGARVKHSFLASSYCHRYIVTLIYYDYLYTNFPPWFLVFSIELVCSDKMASVSNSSSKGRPPCSIFCGSPTWIYKRSSSKDGLSILASVLSVHFYSFSFTKKVVTINYQLSNTISIQSGKKKHD